MKKTLTTIQELIKENSELKKEIQALNHSEVERKRMEDALHDSELQYKTFFETTGTVMMILEDDTTISFVNHEIENLSGYTRDELEGKKKWTEFVQKDDLKMMLDQHTLWRTYPEQAKKSYEFRLIHKDGSLRNILSTHDLIPGTHRAITSLVDITERKKTENILRENEKRLRGITSNVPGVVFQLYVNDNDKCGLSYISESITSIFGIPFPQDIEMLLPEFLASIHAEDCDRFLMSFQKAIETATLWNFEGRFFNPKADMFWVHGLATPTRQEDGLVFDGILLNITERKQAEEKFTKVFMTAPDCIFITRLANGLIMDVNHGFEEISGWTRSEVIGRTDHEIDFWGNLSERNLLVEELQAGRDVLNREFSFRCKDGSLRIGIYSARSIFLAGEQSLIFILQDITNKRKLEDDHHKLEQKLFNSQKMEAIGTLAQGIAHDFNNILSAIMGYAELSLNTVTDRPIVHGYTQQILNATERAKDLVKQILVFSQKVELEKKPLLLTPIVKEVVKFMRASLPTTIEIRQKFDDMSDLIMADATQMHQVLMNLCTNAGYAMKETGGILEIGLKEVVSDAEVFLHNPSLNVGRYLKLFVRDTGQGISQDNLGRIFEPYFTTKGQGEGTGLGLAVVHGIIKDHGGEIKVYSEEGKGTIFMIYLPVIEKKLADGKTVEKVVPMGKGETILLIDDEKMVVDIGIVLLNELGYKVIAATDPIHALELFRKYCNEIDIVITDKTMPHMTGFDVIREIRAVCVNTPVLLCSGLQEKTDMEKLKNLGIVQFIAKPARKSVFATAIRNALDAAK